MSDCEKIALHYADKSDKLILENKELKEKLAAANHDYNELMKERTDYVAENKALKELRSMASELAGFAKAINGNNNTHAWLYGLKKRIETYNEALKRTI